MHITLFSLSAFLALALTVLSTAQEAEARTYLGLAWAADNRWAHKLAKNPNTKYYHHWEMRNVPELSKAGIKYVPTYWGSKKSQNWPITKKLFAKYRYSHVLMMNEPDVSSQSDYSPAQAAKAVIAQGIPLRNKYGTKVSSPQICYNVDWLSSFLRIMKSKGQHVDFLAVHYYGGWNSVEKLKSYIKKIHSKYPQYKIWVTEFGVTSSSNPSASQAKKFFVDSVNWFGSTDYVEVVFPFGMWAKAPDSFGSQQNAAFQYNGALRSLGQYWAHVNPAKRDLIDESSTPSSIMRRHHAMVKRIIEAEPSAEEENWDISDSDARSKAESRDCDESDARCGSKYIDEWLSKADDDQPEDLDTLRETDIVDDGEDNEETTDSEDQYGDNLTEEEFAELESQLQ